MKPPPTPRDENLRLQALRRYELLDTLPEPGLDDLTALAAHICDAPIAHISLLDETRQWFKSKVGFSLCETPRDISFCGHAINGSGLFIVPDATKDVRFADNPLVTGEPHIRFYAGAPLVTPDGQALGALCVIDHVPRQVSLSQQEALRMLARQVMSQMELRRQSSALAESEERWKFALEGSGDGVWDLHVPTRAVRFSKRWKEMLGYAEAEIADRFECWAELVHPEDLPGVMAGFQAYLEGSAGTYVNEHRLRCKDGRYSWILVRGMAVSRDKAGRPLRMVGTHSDITARKQAEAALRESAQKLRRVIDGLGPNSFVGLLSPDGTLLEANQPALAAAGLRLEDVLGQPVDQTYWFAHSAAVQAQLRAAIQRAAAGEPSRFDVQVQVAGGRLVWLDFSLQPVRDARGRVLHLVPSANVIDERKQAEIRIQQLNRTLAVLSDINQTIVREKDPQAMLAAACQIAVEKGRFRLAWIGLADAATGRLQIAAQAGADGDTLQILQQLVAGEPLACTYTDRAWRTGQHGVCNDIAQEPPATAWRDPALQRDYRALASLPLQAGETVIGTFNLYSDIPGFFDADELRLLDELAMDISFALEVGRHEAERSRLGDVLEASLNEIYLFATDSLRFEYVNAGARANIGYTPEQLRHLTPVDLKPEFTEESFRQLLGPLLRHEKSKLVFQTNHRRADGTLYPVEVNLQLVEQPGHRVFLAVILDLTERRQAEESLRRTEGRFRLLIENASDLITVINHQGLIRYQSPSAGRVLGFAPEELVGRNVLDLIHADDAATVTTAIQRTAAWPTQPVTVNYRFRHQDGEWRTLQSIGRDVPGQAEDGFVIVNSRDITETRLLEEQFRQSQKMEAIGQLAGGVAHDFNNILAAIMMQAGLAASAADLPPETRDMLGEIQGAAERAANLTRQLLAFSSRQVMQARQLDLNEIVTNMVKMLQRILGEDVRLQLNLHSRPLLTLADAGMLDQVLLNLVVNSRDAMPGGGQLIIETSEHDFTVMEAATLPDVAPGRCVCLRVTDTGTGIPPEILSRVFEPFYTTKSPGKGTGLGLATVFGIVKQHQGSITVESATGRGTTFRIFLRADETPAETSAGESPAAQPRGGTETILLVEDDHGVRMVTRIILERAGYTVLEAANGPEALQSWMLAAGRVHLLLTDIVMPEGMSGRELATQLQSRQPGLKVIFTSGYSAEIAGRDLTLGERQRLIQKPCAPGTLLETIRDCLDA